LESIIRNQEGLTPPPAYGILAIRREHFILTNFPNFSFTEEITMSDNETGAAVAEEQSSATNIDIPNPDKFHHSIDMKFGFRTVKDEKSGVETKRDTVEVKLPVLNFDGVVRILQEYANAKNAADADPENELAKAAFISAKKSYDLLMGAVQGVYESAIKDYLGDNPGIKSENFPYDQFTWEAIANQPESERRGRGIAKEVWEDFIKSYIAVMPGLTGKKTENIEKQAAILAQKLNPLRNHEDKEKILPNFKNALTVYMNGAGADAEQFAPCVQFLLEKADKILNADKNANLLENLGF
jgi:hypothetical protein